jgi:hypothetical protein
MSVRRFKSALEFDGKVLATYKYKIEIQKRLLETIKSALPKNLSHHALYCVVSEKKVSLYTDSAVWSSQLRFYHKTILRALIDSKQGRFELLQIKVIPKTMEQALGSTPKLPSAENISFIFNQANDQKNNDVLKTALLKLATTFKKLSD